MMDMIVAQRAIKCNLRSLKTLITPRRLLLMGGRDEIRCLMNQGIKSLSKIGIITLSLQMIGRP